MQDLVSALDEIVRHSEWGLCRAAEIEWKGLRRKQKSICIRHFEWVCADPQKSNGRGCVENRNRDVFIILNGRVCAEQRLTLYISLLLQLMLQFLAIDYPCAPISRILEWSCAILCSLKIPYSCSFTHLRVVLCNSLLAENFLLLQFRAS